MDFNMLKDKKVLYVYSNRIAETLVDNCGISQLQEIRYLPKCHEDDNKKKVYVFKNSKVLFPIFVHLIRSKTEKMEGER